jgi:glucokinase
MSESHISQMPGAGPLALVGDFGGTNVRLALTDLTEVAPAFTNVRHFHSKEFARAGDTVTAYLKDLIERPAVAVIAAAGPVDNGAVRFTNLGWSLTERELTEQGFARAQIVNDFVAAACATRLLSESDVYQTGPGSVDKNSNVAVMGPGTGFGASALIADDDGRAVAIAAEGGHASLAPDDEIEIEALRYLMRDMGHVSIERVLSGPGICNLHRALNAMEDVRDEVGSAEEISRRALAGERLGMRTMKRFCAMLGGVAGNLALTYGAKGGLFVAGGIVPSILPILNDSEFRNRFESKGRFAEYLRPIATQVIVRQDAAFLGAAYVARALTNQAAFAQVVASPGESLSAT